MPAPALLIIDIQNDYFADGRHPLVGIERAAETAAELLAAARAAGAVVVHVRHEEASADAPFFVAGTEGAAIHAAVAPVDGEPVVVKSEVNAFRGTGLDEILRGRGVTDLVIVGAMSHMCVDAGTRAALDHGYGVTVAHDAVATRDLAFGERVLPAADVHAAFMAALGEAGAAVEPAAGLAERFGA